MRHFGDLADGQKACGICDFCAPAECVGATVPDRHGGGTRRGASCVAALRRAAQGSTGKLHTDCFRRAMSRDDFEEVLGAMARAGLVRLDDAVFEKDGKQIPYRKASLTPDGEALEEIVAGDLLMKDAALTVTKPRKGRKKKVAAPPAKRKQSPKPAGATGSPIEDALRRWRLSEAKRRGVPAFRIFSDQVLKAVADKRPSTAAELLAIPGLGINTVEKYGAQIYRLIHE